MLKSMTLSIDELQNFHVNITFSKDFALTVSNLQLLCKTLKNTITDITPYLDKTELVIHEVK